MKLLTLNTHSLAEPFAAEKAEILADFLHSQKPDVVALQEVNQSLSADEAAFDGILREGCELPLRRGNFLAEVLEHLRKAGTDYHAAWLPVKVGYGRFDEGLALLARKPIQRTRSILLSAADCYTDWRTRKALGIELECGWFYSVHLSRWDDPTDPFAAQWKRLEQGTESHSSVWLMGDFNAPAHISGEGYELVVNSGWQDCFAAAKSRGSGITAPEQLDGWRDSEYSGMRIDYIFCKPPVKVMSCRSVFSGENEPVISDHFGVMIETEEYL